MLMPQIQHTWFVRFQAMHLTMCTARSLLIVLLMVQWLDTQASLLAPLMAGMLTYPSMWVFHPICVVLSDIINTITFFEVSNGATMAPHQQGLWLIALLCHDGKQYLEGWSVLITNSSMCLSFSSLHKVLASRCEQIDRSHPEFWMNRSLLDICLWSPQEMWSMCCFYNMRAAWSIFFSPVNDSQGGFHDFVKKKKK